MQFDTLMLVQADGNLYGSQASTVHTNSRVLYAMNIIFSKESACYLHVVVVVVVL